MNPLDRPIWSALTGRQAEFARSHGPALAFKSSVEPFAASASDRPQDVDALASLLLRGDILVLIQSTPSPTPEGLMLARQALAVQMISERPIVLPGPAQAKPLFDDDVPQMMELADLTKPGPFRSATHRLGQFWGIKQDRQLVAMAGERLKLPGMSEVSGVCVHPDWRGHGFAAGLSALIARDIQSRGETPFLHAYADNASAIRLYETYGPPHPQEYLFDWQLTGLHQRIRHIG